jgi:hypothetical protein
VPQRDPARRLHENFLGPAASQRMSASGSAQHPVRSTAGAKRGKPQSGCSSRLTVRIQRCANQTLGKQITRTESTRDNVDSASRKWFNRAIIIWTHQLSILQYALVYLVVHVPAAARQYIARSDSLIYPSGEICGDTYARI